MQLIAELQQSLSETMMAWNKFKAPDGDGGYFIDVGVNEQDRRMALGSLRSIDECFDSLGALHRTLISCKERCQSSNEAVSAACRISQISN